MSTARCRRTLAITLVLLQASVGCGPGDRPPDDAGQLSGQLTVFAAASLTDVFGELADAFGATHPELEVVLNLAGSQTLASQINEGAPADVFASADATQLEVVADAGNLAGDPSVFTATELSIAVEAGNPLWITELADLSAPDVVLVLPAEEVPAGKYAREALDAAGVPATPSSLERDVRAALSKVALGEADASIVYATDVAAAGDRVEGVDIPAEVDVRAVYPIATLADAPHPAAADAFVSFVLSEEGQGILASHAFTDP